LRTAVRTETLWNPHKQIDSSNVRWMFPNGREPDVTMIVK